MKHAGIGWPENANGEHPNREAIADMPGMAGAALICSPSGRFHYNYLRTRNPSAIVVWRAIPRQGKLPAQLGWDAKRVADECLNLWDEQPHRGTEWFTPLNELQFRKESGEDFRGYAYVAERLSWLRVELRKRFAALGQDVRLLFPAWVPQDDGDRLHEWQAEARLWDGLVIHCYGSAETMRARYRAYRDAFPDRPIFVGEHNTNHEGHDERAVLQMWAEVADTDPLLLGCAYYIWETLNPGENDLSIWGNGARYGLFLDPPTVTRVPDPPKPEEPTMPPDPWRYWTAQEIASATGCPVAAIREHWPRLNEQLWHCGLDDKPVHLAMISTVAIETASRFEPIHEFRNADGSIPSWWYTYDGGPEYHGRGLIQITHRSNYATYGPKVAELWGTSPDQPDFNLIGEPDRALDPDISAAVAALYFRDHRRDDGYGIPDAARDGDWREVRRLVQGGSAGLDRLVQIVAALGGTVPAGEERTYGPNVPDDVILQRNSWSCAVRATYAALWAMNQQGQGQAVTYGDEGAADVYEWMVPGYDGPGIGLLDHTGDGLAQMLREHGYNARSVYPATLEQVRAEAGRQPVLLGGDSWDHWVYVRGRTADNGLILENPSPGHMGISDYLRDSFGRLGPMAMVVIDGPQVQAPAADYASLTGLAYAEDGVVVPALAAALANPDDANLRVQVDAVVRWLRANRPPA